MSTRIGLALQGILTIWLIVATDANVDLQITPNALVPGFTKTLDVNCSFLMDDNFKGATLLSLVISKSSGPSNTQTTELVSLQSFNPSQINNLANVNATLSGQISQQGDSFLNMRFTDSAMDQSGNYICTGNGMDSVGHPFTYSYRTEVGTWEGNPGSCACQDRILQLKSFMDDLNTQMHNLQVQNSQNFTISRTYYGKRYYLSHDYWKNADVAQASCRVAGGYLAEINDAQEYAFIKSFLETDATGVDRVLLGITDEYTEGDWVYRFSQEQVTFFEWFQNEPDNPENDCVALVSFKEWKMNDFPCYDYDFENRRNFLCEVPV